MNRFIMILIVIVGIAAVVYFSDSYKSPQNTNSKPAGITQGTPTTPLTAAPSGTSGDCDPSLWDHVYNPARLQVIEQCKTVSGVVDVVNTEADGDIHIRLTQDPQFKDLLNDKNISEQHGDLVLEPVCQRRVTQKDAIAACQGFTKFLTIPRPGTHVFVTGSYVLDTAHGWREIHPVTKFEVR